MSQKQSHYAEKRARGMQMYGPGCCAHKLGEERVRAAQERARKAGHFDKPTKPFVMRADPLEVV